MQDVDVTSDPANSCALFITVHSHAVASKRPALSGCFQFEDHIRCVAAKQCLQRNKENLRLAKMTRVAKLLHLPPPDSGPGSIAPSHLMAPNLLDIGSVSLATQLHSPFCDLSHSVLQSACSHVLPQNQPIHFKDVERIPQLTENHCINSTDHTSTTKGGNSYNAENHGSNDKCSQQSCSSEQDQHQSHTSATGRSSYTLSAGLEQCSSKQSPEDGNQQECFRVHVTEPESGQVNNRPSLTHTSTLADSGLNLSESDGAGITAAHSSVLRKESSSQ